MNRKVLVLLSALSCQALAQTGERRVWPWEPQRMPVLYLMDDPQQVPPTIPVAGGVATNLMLPRPVSAELTRLVGGDGRFEPLMIAGRSVVVVPRGDLEDGEEFSLVVVLEDGAAVPFVLRAPRYHAPAASQVDVFLEQESPEVTRRFLQEARARVEELAAENERHAQEETSVGHALAALLAAGRSDLTPFVEAHRDLLRCDGAEIKVTTYRRRERKVDLDKAAVVLTVTNRDPAKVWTLEEVRLLAAETGTAKPFALRVVSPALSPGQTGRVAVVLDMDAFGDNRTDRLVLEIWRAGDQGRGDRQAWLELVAADDSGTPISVGRRRR